MRFPPFRTQVLLLLAAAPAAVLAALVARYGVNVPVWDDWEHAALIEKARHGLTISDLLAQHNESRPAVGRIIVLLLAWTVGWNLKLQMAMSVLFAGVLSFSIYRINRQTFSADE